MFRSLGRCFPPNLSAHIPPPIIISTSVHWWLKMIQIPGFTSPIVRISSLKCIFCLQRRSGWPKFFSLMTEVFLFFGEDNWARDPTIQSSTVRGPICFDFFFSLFLTKYYSGTLISTLCVIRSLEPWCFVSISFEGKFVHTAALCV